MSEFPGTSTSSSAGSRRNGLRGICALAAVASCLCLPAQAAAGGVSKTKQRPEVEVPPLVLAGGRSLVFERTFSNDRDVRVKRGFWTRVLDLVAGAPDFHALVRPYELVTDSHGRIIVTDPGVGGIHIFDFAQQKYKFVSRREGKDALDSPQCVAVDDKDNIYVTDSETGKVLVFAPSGKFQRAIGSLKGGEGYFKRPTGIALDAAANRIYVTDTLRHKIYVTDLQGSVLQTIGQRGTGPGEFNFPTVLRLHGDELLVVDAMNFRVQALDRSGRFLRAVGRIGESSGSMFRPKGVALDSENTLYVADGLFDTVQAFDAQGRLLYYFGQSGDGPEEFQMPSGLFIDPSDRIYVVDSLNRRVQVLRYLRGHKAAGGGGQ